MSGYRLDTNGLWHGLILGFYEHGDESCVSGLFLDNLSEYYLLNYYSALFTYC
jgi:hypothetical protein